MAAGYTLSKILFCGCDINIAMLGVFRIHQVIHGEYVLCTHISVCNFDSFCTKQLYFDHLAPYDQNTYSFHRKDLQITALLMLVR